MLPLKLLLAKTFRLQSVGELSVRDIIYHKTIRLVGLRLQTKVPVMSRLLPARFVVLQFNENHYTLAFCGKGGPRISRDLRLVAA